jgi:predicted GTPase
VDVADPASVERVIDEVRGVNPTATIVRAASPVRLDDPQAVRGRRVLVVEDGPTITHGGMAYGAGYLAATRGGAAAIVDPRELAGPALRALYAKYSHIGRVLPAVGYDTQQLEDLREAIIGLSNGSLPASESHGTKTRRRGRRSHHRGRGEPTFTGHATRRARR